MTALMRFCMRTGKLLGSTSRAVAATSLSAAWLPPISEERSLGAFSKRCQLAFLRDGSSVSRELQRYIA
jgi:hypothetical protein